MIPPTPTSTLFPYTTLFRSAYSYKTFVILQDSAGTHRLEGEDTAHEGDKLDLDTDDRSEEHTSELQSHSDLVCRLLLEKKKKKEKKTLKNKRKNHLHNLLMK